MFCRKCGRQIPDDSDFCPECGVRNCVEIEAEPPKLVKRSIFGGVSLEKDNVATNESNAVQISDMICRNCGKRLDAAWVHCPYCHTENPFYDPLQSALINTPQVVTPPPQVIVPPPQVIIKEERVVVTEKPEEKGCGTIVGEIIGSLLVLAFIIGGLQSCFGYVS